MYFQKLKSLILSLSSEDQVASGPDGLERAYELLQPYYIQVKVMGINLSWRSVTFHKATLQAKMQQQQKVETLYFLSMRKPGQGRLWRSVPTSRPSIKVNLKISSKMGMDRSFKMDRSCRVGLRYRNAGNAMFSRSRLRDALRLYTQASFISREMQNNKNGRS